MAELETYRVAHTMREMYACRAKSNSCKGGREEHLALRIAVLLITGDPGEVADGLAECPVSKDVAHRVAALISWPEFGVGWAWRALVVGNGGITFQRME